MIKHLENDEFQKLVLESKQPVVVDFYATWCGPCQYMEPVIEEIAQEMEGKVNVYKVNIDEARDLAIDQGIVSVPTFIFVKDGKVVSKNVGTLSKQDFLAKINSIL